ncbi:MAG: hypothetical protein L0221_02925, partial [Chloroflexi bacterium]|nr:hypothetical protein [Chloroflexota bacterium]
SPEGCAAILWRSADQAATAALAMKMTAADQLELGVVDRVVPEPAGGAHVDPAETARRLKAVIVEELDRLAPIPLDDLVDARYRRYRSLGAYTESAVPVVVPPPSKGLGDRLRDLLDPSRWLLGTPPPSSARRDESNESEV